MACTRKLSAGSKRTLSKERTSGLLTSLLRRSRKTVAACATNAPSARSHSPVARVLANQFRDTCTARYTQKNSAVKQNWGRASQLSARRCRRVRAHRREEPRLQGQRKAWTDGKRAVAMDHLGAELVGNLRS